MNAPRHNPSQTGRYSTTDVNACTGYIPCRHANLTVGHNYVIVASLNDNGEYHPGGEFGVDNRQELTRLATVCGLQAVYPHGT